MKALLVSTSPWWAHFRAIAAYGAGPALGLLSGPLLARALGPEGRGHFVAIMEPVTLAGAIAAFGVPSAVAHFSAKFSNGRAAMRRGMALVLIPLVITLGVLAVYARAVASNLGIGSSALLALWLVVIPSVGIQIVRAERQGRGAWRVLDGERLLFAVLRFLAILMLTLLGVTMAEVFAIASLLAFLLAAVILLYDRPPAETDVAPRRREFASYSILASVGTISVVANNRLDQVILPLLSSGVEIGYYAVAVTVAEVPLVLGTLAARNALTMGSLGHTVLDVWRNTRPYLILGAVAAGVLAVASGYLIPVFFGLAFQGSVTPAIILCASSILSLFCLPLIGYMSGVGHPGLSSLVPLAGFLSTLALYLASASGVTSIGAALYALISQGVCMLVGVGLLVWWSRRTKRGSIPVQ